MPVYRLQTIFQRDSAFPTDGLVITPHFDVGGVVHDPQQLCDDLVAALDTWDANTGQITVRAYDAQGTPPVYPVGEAVVNPGLYPAAGGIREACICLSFFAGQNRPRQRGRLYVPGGVASIATTGARPTVTQRQKVAELVPIFTALGGENVDWVVYSRADNQARSITNWWIDDAWDIQRSRGLRPTSRLEGTTSEA